MKFAHSHPLQVMKGLLSFLFLLTSGITVFAQNESYVPLAVKPGSPAGSYALTDIDTINLFSGRVNVRLPLMTRMGRGDVKAEVTLTRDSPVRYQVFMSYDGNGNPIWGIGGGGGFSMGSSRDGEHWVYPQGVGTGAQNWCSEGLYTWGEKTLTRFFWVEPNGTEHEMRDVLTNGQPLQSGGCWTAGPYRGRVFAATDGSGATYIADEPVRDGIYVNNEYPVGIDWKGWLLLKDGRKIRISWDSNTHGMRDRNGNMLPTSWDPWSPFKLDNLNRTRNWGSGTTAECNALLSGYANCSWESYKGFGGTLRKIYYFNDSSYRLTAILFPNGQTYRFYYNQYDDLIRIDLPTGGSLEYDFEPGLSGPQPDFSFISGVVPGTYSDVTDNGFHVYRRLTERRVYREGHVLESRQTFSKPEDVYLNNAGFVEKKEYDANGTLLRSEKHYFYGSAEHSFWIKPTEYPAWKDGLEYRTEFYDGNGNLLRKTERTWEQRAPVNWWTGSSDAAPANDPRVSQEVNYLEEGTFRITSFGYDPYVPYNSVTDVYEKQFNTYAIVRHTQTEYLKMLNGIDYSGSNIQNGTDPHFRDFPIRVSVYDGGGTERARTTFEYDNYLSDTNHAPLVSRVGIGGLDPTYTSSFQRRANITGITKHFLTNGTVTGSVTSYSQYDVAGNIVKSINPLGCATTVSYTDAFGAPNAEARANSSPTELSSVSQSSFAFPTSVSNCLGHTSYVQYDFYIGKPVDAEDINGVVASGYFNDPMERATQIVAAANQGASVKSETSFVYNDPARIVTTKSDKTTYNDNALKTEVVFDGLGRTVETRQYEDSSNFIATKQIPYVFLQDGANWFEATQTSNPYRPYLNEQPVWTTTYNDRLGRAVKVKTPDNAVVTTTYNGLATTVTDQAGKKRKSVVDEFGRVAEIYEDPDSLNYLTSYAYDVLGNLVRVVQGPQQRYFMYDSLGRMIRAKHPEQTAYAPINLTDPVTGNSQWTVKYEYDNNGNMRFKTDARGIVTEKIYDSLDRVTNVLYRIGGQPDPNTGDLQYMYDNAGFGKGRLWLTFRWGSKPFQTAVGYYDASGRVKQFYNLYGDGQGGWLPAFEINRTYDLAGNVATQTYPSLHTVSYTYDGAGRTGSFSGNLGDGTTRTYSTGINYSPFGSLSKEQFGTSTPLYRKSLYNIRGQLFDTRVSSVNDLWDWNRGRMILYYSSNHLWGQSGTDNNGNVRFAETWIPPENATLDQTDTLIEDRYDYDALNRLSYVAEQKMSVAGGWGNWTQQFRQTYTYDRYGNRTINTDPAQTWGTGINNKSFTVDTGTNRLGVPGGQPGAMTYDNAGNLTNDTYTGAGNRTYDAQNRIVTAADNTGQTSRYGYDAAGNRIRRQVASSQEQWQIYGIDGELLAEYGANAPASAPDKEYGYRGGELLVTATGRVNVALAANGAVATASTAHTCCGFSTTGAINGNNRGPWGNGEGWNDATENVVPDWIQVDFAGSKTIDEINVFSLHDNYTVENTPTETQTFTLYGLLSFNVQYWNGSSWVTVPGGSVTGNNKVWRRFTFAAITTSKIRVYINAVPDAWSRVVEIQAFGTAASNERVQWLVPDHLGSPRMVLDASGTLANVRRHDYLPFGEELTAGMGGRTSSLGYNTDSVRQKFTGYEADGETSLNYAKARYQSSVQGRFTSVDPIDGTQSDPQTWNKYAYVGNNPVNTTDPSGMSYFVGGGVNDPEIYQDGFRMAPTGTYSQIDTEPWGEGVSGQRRPAALGGIGAAAGRRLGPIMLRLTVNMVRQDNITPNPNNRITGSYIIVLIFTEGGGGEDLSKFWLREKLEYTGTNNSDGSWSAPKPFVFRVNSNPKYVEVQDMTDPNLADRHSGYSAEPPYSEVKVQIKQTYQYSRDRKNWTDLTTLTITRTITRTPQGGWEQRITTSLSQKTAVISLPADGFYNTP